MEEVIPLTGTLAHTSKDRESRVLLRNVIDEFHDGHGLAHTRATEQADFAAFGDRHNEVDDLNAGFEDVDRRRLVGITRRLAVNRQGSVGTHGSGFVHGIPQNVHDPTQGLLADRHGNRCARVIDLKTALESIA